jgi:hypothetical protein
MNFFHHRVVRLPIVAIGFAAWLAISNHCVIGAVGGAGKMPMASCHSTAPANQSPGKHDQKSDVECCKVLRATLLTLSSTLVGADTLAFAAHDYIIAVISAVDELQLTPVIEWDTGPPGADSFAESVLQRSILAHAPPLSLS